MDTWSKTNVRNLLSIFNLFTCTLYEPFACQIRKVIWKVIRRRYVPGFWSANVMISNIESKIKVGVDFNWLTNQNLCEKGKHLMQKASAQICFRILLDRTYISCKWFKGYQKIKSTKIKCNELSLAKVCSRNRIYFTFNSGNKGRVMLPNWMNWKFQRGEGAGLFWKNIRFGAAILP